MGGNAHANVLSCLRAQAVNATPRPVLVMVTVPLPSAVRELLAAYLVNTRRDR